jgi:hypothetical protein
LHLAARERRRRLAQLDVAQSHVLEMYFVLGLATGSS